MLKRTKYTQRRSQSSGQTLLEYSLLLGIIIAALYVMTSTIKRGTQSLVKLSADQIGVQLCSERTFDESGHMDNAVSFKSSDMHKVTNERAGATTYTYYDESDEDSLTYSNLGLTPPLDDQ